MATYLSGTERIQQERNRQITVLGFDREQDLAYVSGELLAAAAVYLQHGLERGSSTAVWPWPEYVPDFSDRDACLVKAAALIAAELDRRTATQQP